MATPSRSPATASAALRIGCLTTEVSRMARLAEMGYEYADLRCRALVPTEDEPTFAATLERILEAPIRPEAMSGFIPPYIGLPVVGPAADRARLRRYTEMMLGRAARAGAQVVVFGAGLARTFPEGFAPGRALDQLRDFLAFGADVAAARGLTLALEALNRGETNLVNTLDEAAELVRGLGRPALRLAVDYYHLLADGQDLEPVRRLGGLIAHAHTADAARRPPGSAGTDQAAFLAALRAGGYRGRLSVECRFEEFEREAPAALAYLRDTWRALPGG